MKNSIFLDCHSSTILKALADYLSDTFIIAKSTSDVSLKAIIFDRFPNLMLLKDFHERHPNILIYLLVSPTTKTPLFPFPVKVLERPIVLKTLKIQLKEPLRKTILSLNEFKLYLHNRRLTHSETNKTTLLTEKETEILAYLYNTYPQFVDREALLKEVWNYMGGVTTHTVETHIYKLKQKLILSSGENLIKTNSDGYSLNL